MFGSELLNVYVEQTREYKDLPDLDADRLKILQKEMKDKILDKFFGIMLSKQSNQSCYGNLLRE